MSEFFEYSDGAETEHLILDVLKTARNIDSLSHVGIEHYGKWPFRCHLSPWRSALLRPFNWTGLKVLEIGSGLGAISRFLAESSGSLSLLDSSNRRMDAARERVRGLEKTSFQIGNFFEVQNEPKFDVVTSIGVLEYASLFAPAERQPHHAFLKKARAQLQDEGVLVLAIENQIGLKYWTGTAEDHDDKLYSGIAGYRDMRSPRTFSKKTLTELLRETGFEHIEFYYPYPDYKLPRAILSENFMAKNAKLSATLSTLAEFENYTCHRIYTAPDMLASQTLAEAGILQDMANSFLVLASPNKSSKTLQKLRTGHETAGAWVYSLNRTQPLVTTFEGTGTLNVRKHVLSSETPPPSPDFEHRLDQSTPILDGTPLLERLARIAYFEDWEKFEELFLQFLVWSINRLSTKSLDAVPSNTLVTEDGEFQLFDLEWSSKTDLPPSWFVLRCCLSLDSLHVYLSRAPWKNLETLYLHFCERTNVRPNFSSDVEREVRFQIYATSQKDADTNRIVILRALQTPFNLLKFPRNPQEELNGQLHVKAELDRIYSSKAWKLTSGLRRALHLIRPKQI